MLSVDDKVDQATLELLQGERIEIAKSGEKEINLEHLGNNLATKASTDDFLSRCQYR